MLVASTIDVGTANVPTTGSLDPVNHCPHAAQCKCVTNGLRAKQITEFGGHNLAGGGIPACSEEIRHLLAPGQSGLQILKKFPRA